jgi:ATP-dependent Clp protease ATP-binding subunit ClpX
MRIRKRLACSFCGKSAADVAKLVAGPKVFICDQCVTMAAKIMNEDGPRVTAPPARDAGFERRRGWLRGLFGRDHFVSQNVRRTGIA